MRRILILLLVLAAPLLASAEGKVLKVLPQFLDKKGQDTLSPSLYERDAYQAYMRKHPGMEAALRLAVEWKASNVDWSKLKLRAEMRGLVGDKMHTITLEQPTKKSGFFGNIFGNWAEFRIQGTQFHQFGRLIAWRVTLWEGDRQIGELQSFLWSGIASD